MNVAPGQVRWWIKPMGTPCLVVVTTVNPLSVQTVYHDGSVGSIIKAEHHGDHYLGGQVEAEVVTHVRFPLPKFQPEIA